MILRATLRSRQDRDSYPRFTDEYAESRKHYAGLNHWVPKWLHQFSISGSLTMPPPWERSTHVSTLCHYEVWWGPVCLLSLSYCNNKGPCKHDKREGLPAKAPWNSIWLPGMMKRVGTWARGLHTAPPFTGGPASASNIHNHPVDNSRSQTHNIQNILTILRAGHGGIREPHMGLSLQQHCSTGRG